jgi:hypothetical protein
VRNGPANRRWPGRPAGGDLVERGRGTTQHLDSFISICLHVSFHHSAQEMNHLAGFLPELYEAFGNE